MSRAIAYVLTAAVLVLGTRDAVAFPERLELELGGAQRLSLVLVRAGTFQQGSPPDERGRGVDEPQRAATITRDFYIGEVPVLQGQFARFVAATGYRTEAETGRSGGFGFDGRGLVQRPAFTWRSPGFAQTDEHPAVIVTFDDATRFVAWASAQTGRRVRLPTEVEWESACRGGTTTAYYAGATDDAARASGWFREGSGDGTRPVRAKTANALGLSDMVGHVQQWVADWYAPYEPGPVTDPFQRAPGSPPGEPARRVLRGGSWLRGVTSGRCAARARATPGSRNADTGFRVVVEAQDAPVQPAVVPAQMPPAREVPPPEVTPTNEDGGIGLFEGLCGAVALGGAGVTAWLLARRRKRLPTSMPAPHGASSRAVQFVPQADGFRIVAPPSLAGWSVRCRYRAGGKVHEQDVLLEHSGVGQFVYTGMQPTGVEALGFVQASHNASSFGHASAHPHASGGFHPPDDHSSSHFDPPAAAPWHGGDPPAY